MPDVATREATFDDQLGVLRFRLEQVCGLLEASLLAAGDLGSAEALLVVDEVRRDNDQVQALCTEARREALALMWHIPGASHIPLLFNIVRDTRALARMGWLVVDLAETGAPVAASCGEVLAAVQAKMLAATTDLYVAISDGDRDRAHDIHAHAAFDRTLLDAQPLSSAGGKHARRLVRACERWTGHAMAISRRAAIAAA
jgi:hypothetical protein